MNKIVVGILAHVDAGKTTLSESILYNTGAIRQMGRVDKKDAFLDTDCMEKERGITIFSKQACFNLSDDIEVNLIDTPGHVDFSPEAERTLWVLDYAILVVSALDGVQGHTRTLFNLLERHGVPTFIFVNKMDQPGTDRDVVLKDIKRELSDMCIPFDKEFGEPEYEEMALSEERLMEKYLESGSISKDDIIRLVYERKIYPVMFGSALKNTGVMELLEIMRKYIVEPEAGLFSEERPFGAKVYKITRDEQGNRLTHLKITSGRLNNRQVINDKDKITQIRVYSGTKFEAVPNTLNGGVYAVLGLTDSYGGQGMGIEEDAPSASLEPVMTYKVILPSEIDPGQMMIKLNELMEDLPEIHALWDEELREIHVSIMGEVQLEILKQIILDRYDIKIEFGAGKIVYKETIANIVEGVGHFEPLRHYAEAHLKLEPGERGSGIQVFTDADTDQFALNWQRLIMTHVLEKTHRGVLVGAALTDVKITVLAGRAHPKHTMGGDFRQATYRAIRQGLMQAQNVLLEPYFSFELRIPDQYVGRAMTDLDRRSAKFSGPFPEGEGCSLIKGSAPVSVMQDYPMEVVAYSQGKGELSCAFLGYDICHNSEEVITERGYDPEADIRNTPDSVFCSHGAGVVIPWSEVCEHMHVPMQLSFGPDGAVNVRIMIDEEEELQRAAIKAKSAAGERSLGGEMFIGYEEVDAIVSRATGSNAKASKIDNGDLAGVPGWKKIRRSDSGSSPDSGVRKRVYKPTPDREKYMLVDGYNVIHAWKELSELAGDNLDGARGRLLDILCNYQAMKNINLIAVFDAYKVKGHVRELETYHNINVVYTKEAETADAYIEKFTHENASKYDITVVTSDGVEQVIIMGAGCSLVSSREFEKEVEEINNKVRSEHIEDVPVSGNKFFDNLSNEGKRLLTSISDEDE